VAYPKTSKLFEAARQYILTRRPDRIYLVSATPTRSPMAIWAAGVLLGRWGMDTFFQFRDIYYIPMPTDRRIFLVRKDKKTKERLGKVVRSLGYTGRLSDWVDVPDQTYKDVEVGLTKEQNDMLEEIPLMYPDPLVGTQKMYQVEQGFLHEEGEPTKVFKENYSKKILEYWDEFHKLFLIVNYTWQIDYLEKVMKKHTKNVFVISGKRKDREQQIEKANSVEEGVVIAQAMVTSGYELPSYPCTIFVSFSHRIVDYIQACGRVLRANAIKKNLYIHLITGEQSEARLESIKQKEDFHEATYAKEKYKKLFEKQKDK